MTITKLVNQRGSSIVEILVVTAISGMLMSALIPALLHITSGTIKGNTSLTAIQDIQNAVRWIIHDGQMAQATDLVNEAPPVSSVTMTWTEWRDYQTVEYSSSYFLSGDDLQRNYNGNVITVARYISDIQFSSEGPAIVVVITSSPRGEFQEGVQRTWKVTLRST